eukprot:gene28244-50072_t
MRGKTVIFQTAVAVVCQASGFVQEDVAPVRVVFRDLSDAEIENYLRAETPYDCAGSAKSEGLGIALLESIDNDDPSALPHAACGWHRAAGTGMTQAPSSAKGTLYLVPAPLDFGCATQSPLDQSMPAHTLAVAASLRHWICENAKSTRAYLKRVDATHPLGVALQELNIQELPREVHKKGDHLTGAAGGFDATPLLAAALQGHHVGLVSEAGMPAIADPGSSVVRAAHDLGLRVVPLVGPVSLLLALAASGLN